MVHLLKALRALAIAALLFFTLLPIYWIIVTSLRPDAEVLKIGASMLPQTWTLEHYQYLFAQTNVGKFLGNSLIVSVLSTAISVGFSLPAAYAFSRLRYPGKLAENTRMWVLSTRFIPPFAIAIPLFLFFRDLKLLDTIPGLVLAHTAFSIPFTLWILQAGFDELPKEVEEAGLIDGCDRWQIFTRIALPLVVPSILCATIFSLLLSWNEFLFALLLTVNKANTLPLLVSQFVTDRSLQWGNIAASSAIASVPMVFFLIFTQRYLVRGLTAGAVK
jgi:multiple sugar transport system permease protein